GRIGLAVARGSQGRRAYACVQAYPGSDTSASRPRGGLYRTDDGGMHWELVNPDGGLANGYFGRLIVSPSDSSRVYLMGRSIRVSRDGGRHFDVWRGSPGGDGHTPFWYDPPPGARDDSRTQLGARLTPNGWATWMRVAQTPTTQ